MLKTILKTKPEEFESCKRMFIKIILKDFLKDNLQLVLNPQRYSKRFNEFNGMF